MHLFLVASLLLVKLLVVRHPSIQETVDQRSDYVDLQIAMRLKRFHSRFQSEEVNGKSFT